MLRANYQGVGTAYRETDPVKVCTAYEAFILDYLAVSARVVKTVISKAAIEAFEGLDGHSAEMFGRQIAHAVQVCGLKVKSISSGLKTPPSVLRIARALQKAKDRTTPANQADQPAVKTHFWRGRRALAKSMSDPAKDEPDVKKASP